jgi:hypothetical protein
VITLREAKEKFKGEWLAFLVKKETPEVAGEILDHDKDKHTIHERLRAKGVKYAYITYAGPYVKPGYEVLF